MQNLSYTKSVGLTEQLHKIDDLRRELLLIPLSPMDELALQWEAQLSLIHYLLGLGGVMVEKDHIKEYLSPLGQKQPHPHQALIESYKHAHDYLYHNWLVTSKPVTAEALSDFYQAIYNTPPPLTDDTLNTSLRYIQVNPEHPVIQAALAQILILTTSPFGENSEQFAQLILLLFLYKYGYDMRRMPVLAAFFYRDIVNYKNMVIQTSRQQNVTAWLEYVSQGVIDELQKTLTLLHSPREQMLNAGKELFELNERQQAIIALFNQPGVKVSNKTVQRKFKVSQITASRDLAKLTTLGIVFPIGKGRSTYYTKV